MVPPHPGLDTLTNVDELKHLCPAFSKGCPFANMEEVASVAVSRGEVSRCPAFEKGCPFSNKSKEEIVALLAEIPKDHPTLNMSELPSCEEGVALVKLLNNFLEKSQLSTLYNITNEEAQSQEKVKDKETENDYLEDPQLASAMREGTKVVHRAAETSVFTKRFLKGEINADEYGRYINSLYFVYKNMEDLLEKHKDHPVVKLIHFPYELNRTKALTKDLEYFYGSEKVSQLIDPASMTPAVKHFVQAMNDACDKTPALLIAHSYSRYLGDLSGGQILAKRLKKCVLLIDENDAAWDTSEGLAFYVFDRLQGNQADFKNFYRERLNAAKVNQETRDMIVAEAVKSFELNIALFDEIQELSEKGLLIPSIIQLEGEGKNQKAKEAIAALKEVDIADIELNTTSSASSKKNNKTLGVTKIAIGIAVIAIGAALYKRFYEKK
ncbi:heme oxygenase-domain-containing protein [Mycotypha africana]|uniref:heme oxygenase-domain-containing protein n=1 Tax=Mycotypha africana TaxID=64632 RepID=UPI0023005708|nr:heme oxygenase-domain-containing protein [Mycotypha africana]KAI8984222.1 heme oxygenase-domain-containing protein [Mycotypha africana]